MHVRTAPPIAPTSLCGAPSNPWGYTFCGGAFVYGPPSNFCAYFSQSGGIQGSCSQHGGNLRGLNVAR